MKSKKFTVIVHGGAWDIPTEVHDAHLRGIRKAAQTGIKCLERGSDAVSTVIEVVKYLETDPAFDAGCGSFLNMNGEVEMDAIVMNGIDLSSGAVAAIQNVEHPVESAELVRTKTEHILLCAQGATDFAHQHGISFWPTENLLVGRERERYELLKKKKNLDRRKFFEHARGRDTVGAVVMDCDGNIAAATSTGGTPNKLPGRVGDSPVIGAGAYADNHCGGASSTGYGESILTVLLAKTATDYMQNNSSAQKAAHNAIRILADRVSGRGGVICIDRNGSAGFDYNTPYMVRAIATETGLIHVDI
jgi:beta-aspartyl-peptidase (threonine type)